MHKAMERTGCTSFVLDFFVSFFVKKKRKRKTGVAEKNALRLSKSKAFESFTFLVNYSNTNLATTKQNPRTVLFIDLTPHLCNQPQIFTLLKNTEINFFND